MSWITKIVDRFRGKSPLDVPDYMSGKPYMYTDPTNPTMMLQISWVYSCVRIISQAVKRTPLRVYRGTSDNEITNGPLHDILHRPNAFMSGKQLLEGTQMWMEIHGNAFWYLSELDRRGQPKEIWLLDSRNMSVVPDMKNLIAGYVYEVNGKQIPLDLDEVIHFKSFNPFNPFMGMGTLQAIGTMLETEQYRDDYDKAFFKNGAVLSGVLQTPKTLSKAVFDRLKREFRAVYGGAKNAHKIAVFEEGLEFKQITLSQRDMEFLEMARFNRDRILAAFGVPPSKLGLVEDANRANSESQDKTFMSETMFPKLADLEERINNELCPRYGRDRVAFDEVEIDYKNQACLKPYRHLPDFLFCFLYKVDT